MPVLVTGIPTEQQSIFRMKHQRGQWIGFTGPAAWWDGKSRYSLIAVYMMASRPGGALYTGVTSDLIRHVEQHRAGTLGGFTKRYGCKTLVYYECFGSMAEALAREHTSKGWSRDWKDNVINAANPECRDLFDDLAA